MAVVSRGKQGTTRRGGGWYNWFQLFGREEELFDAYVTGDYLPIQIMSTLVVLLSP